MSDKYDLGELSLVNARGIWLNEATHFTPWLARAENIMLLGNALGLELEVENTEVGVGPYSADILARDTGSDGYVVIENQLEKINHDHVGKALVYAAALDAGTVVWVAVDFTDEHRRTIDWLNDNSTGDVAFFGVQLEVWQIGGSKPAPRFNVVSRPADAVTRAAIGKATAGLTDTRKLQLEWWTHFRDALAESGVVPSVQAPKPRYWYNVSIGRTGFALSCIADTYADRIGVRLYMRGRHGAGLALEQLLEEQTDIEREIGHALDWDPNPDAEKDRTVASIREASPLDDRSRWPEYAEWLVREVETFRRVFGPRIREMDLSPEAMEILDDGTLTKP